MSLYRPLEAPEGIVRCKLFSSGGVLLSEVLPTFEHMGAKVVDERPYEITPADRAPAWIYDFGLRADADEHRAGPRPVPGRVPRRLARRARGRRVSTASCSARP